MHYKTILVDLGNDPARAERIDAAVGLAIRFDAAVVGLTATGPQLEPFRGAGEEAGKYAALAGDQQDQLAGENLAALQEAVRKGGPTVRYSHVVLQAESGWALATEGRFADLILPPPLEGAGDIPLPMAHEVEYALLNAGRPVLLVRPGAKLALPGHVLIAWDGSRPAARAVSDALPLLALASAVTIMVVSEAEAAPDTVAGERLAAWLSTHGVRATLRVEQGGSPGEVLLRAVQALPADLLVAGGYGRNRLRELVLGGTTRTLVRSVPVPLLMSH